MHNKLYTPLPEKKHFLHTIHRIWEVRADSSYNVIWKKRYPHNGLIILRTFNGEGIIRLEKKGELNLFPQSILIFSPSLVKYYRTSKAIWSFLWVEYNPPFKFNFSSDKVFALPVADDELTLCAESLQNLGKDEFSNYKACLKLNLMILNWFEKFLNSENPTDTRTNLLAKIARLMSKTTEKPLAISELAERACLSQPHFRQLFKSEFGVSPKKYYSHIRMSKALHWLRTTDMKLSEIADRLSFSSQYHLSREFRKHFGKTPSEFRPRLKKT